MTRTLRGSNNMIDGMDAIIQRAARAAR